jgi:PII-like signaling protein
MGRRAGRRPLPARLVIEIVDAKERIDAFLPVVDELVTEGLVTLEAVRVLKYVAGTGAR